MFCVVGKVTLDIICDTAFGYKTDCLHNPANELAVAFEQLLDLQSGDDMARLVAGISIPGVAHLLASDWLYRHRALVGKIPTLRNVELLIDSMHRIRKISREILRAKTADLSVPLDDMSTKQDIMSLIVRAHKAELDANPVAEVISDKAMVDQVLNILITGHEPVALGLTWVRCVPPRLIYCLTGHRHSGSSRTTPRASAACVRR
jgi:cytochrome P450